MSLALFRVLRAADDDEIGFAPILGSPAPPPAPSLTSLKRISTAIAPKPAPSSLSLSSLTPIVSAVKPAPSTSIVAQQLSTIASKGLTLPVSKPAIPTPAGSIAQQVATVGRRITPSSLPTLPTVTATPVLGGSSVSAQVPVPTPGSGTGQQEVSILTGYSGAGGAGITPTPSTPATPAFGNQPVGNDPTSEAIPPFLAGDQGPAPSSSSSSSKTPWIVAGVATAGAVGLALWRAFR